MPGSTVYHLPITTAANGTFTDYVSCLPGKVYQIFLDKGALDDPDIDITLDPTGVVILSVDAVSVDTTWLPRLSVCSTAGTAILLIAETSYALSEPACTGGQRIKVAITGGGNTLSGDLWFWISDLG